MARAIVLRMDQQNMLVGSEDCENCEVESILDVVSPIWRLKRRQRRY